VIAIDPVGAGFVGSRYLSSGRFQKCCGVVKFGDCDGRLWPFMTQLGYEEALFVAMHPRDSETCYGKSAMLGIGVYHVCQHEI